MYLATNGNSFGRNEHTRGLVRLPSFGQLKGEARELRRLDRVYEHHYNLPPIALSKTTIKQAYGIALDRLNPKDD